MCLLCGGLLLGFALAEAVVRLLGIAAIPAPRRVVMNGRSAEWCCGPEVMDGRIHKFLPGSVFQHCYDGVAGGDFDADGCVSYRINDQGFRGEAFTRAKPPGVYRIVILGDSFTFGEGTPEGRIFPVVLRDTWRDRLLSGRHVEVINLGVPNEDAASELRTYQDFARTLGADWVIVQWNTNDVPISSVQKEHVQLIGRQYRELFADMNRYSWSRLLSIVYARLRAREISNALVTVTRADADAVRGSFEPLAELAEMARQDGSRCTVLAFPELVRFDAYPYASLVVALEQFCRDRGIELVNLLPALSTYRDRELWVHPADHHPNAVAHGIAARALSDALAAGAR